MEASPTRGAFEALGLDPALVKVVRGLGFEVPTPIQKQAIPHIIAGEDVIATAQTGSGKTAAFLLPILQRLLKERPGKTRALVLSPTRELAAQTDGVLRDLARGTRIRGHAVFGGVGMGNLEQGRRARVDVLVATPGRVLDHLYRRNVGFRALDTLVPDEAGRILAMG